MEGQCSRWNQCKAFKKIGCSGCGFQHFDRILNAHSDNVALRYLGDEFFDLCSIHRKGTGGRVSLDTPIEKLFRKEIPELRELPYKNLRVSLTVGKETIDFEAKCDGAFEANGKYIFYEIKGYGDNTNDILSAIVAAELLKETGEYRNSYYYYVGISSGKKGIVGLERKDFFDKGRTKISPYVKWAESKSFLKFYGIADIDDLLKEIKDIVHSES